MFPTGDQIVDNANFDYYSNLVKEEGVLQAGSCCIRGAGKQLAICGRQFVSSGANIVPDANNRIQNVAAF